MIKPLESESAEPSVVSWFQLFGVRRPGAALVHGDPAPLRSQAFNLTEAVIAQVRPKRRLAGALQRVAAFNGVTIQSAT